MPTFETGGDGYNAEATGLHWTIPILRFVRIYIGWTFGNMARGPARDPLFDWHKKLGFLVPRHSVGRLVWRLINPPPLLPPETPGWEKQAANASRIAFYVILISLALTGWAAISTGRAALMSSLTGLIGSLSWPLIPRLPQTIHEPMQAVHELMVKVTCALVILHPAAALKHQSLDRGGRAGCLWPFPRRLP